jgi:trk system potassium uptake protein TrkA
LQHDYQVKLIDHNKKRCEALAESLSKVTVLCAEASDEELLINENIENTDIFISLTNDDEANILAAIQAKKLGAKTLMALINRKAYVDLIEGGVIQHILSPQYATIGSILTHVRQGDVVQVTSLIRGKAEALEIIIHGDDNNSMVIGRTVAAIKWPTGVTLFGIKRQEDSFIPDKTTIIEKEDHLLLLVLNKQSIPALEKLLQVSAHFF